MLFVGSWSQDQQQPCNQINDSRTIWQGASQTLSRVPSGVLFISSDQWEAFPDLTPGSQTSGVSRISNPTRSCFFDPAFPEGPWRPQTDARAAKGGRRTRPNRCVGVASKRVRGGGQRNRLGGQWWHHGDEEAPSTSRCPLYGGGLGPPHAVQWSPPRAPWVVVGRGRMPGRPDGGMATATVAAAATVVEGVNDL